MWPLILAAGAGAALSVCLRTLPPSTPEADRELVKVTSLLATETKSGEPRQSLAQWLGKNADARQLDLALALQAHPERESRWGALTKWHPGLAAELAELYWRSEGDSAPLQLVFNTWAKHDVKRLGRQLRSLEEQVRGIVLSGVVQTVAQQQPQAMGELMRLGDADQWPKEEQKEGIKVWMAEDAENALAWLKEMPGEGAFDLARQAFLFAELGNGGAEAVLGAFDGEGLLDSHQYDGAGADIGFTSLREGLDFALGLQDESARRWYLSRVLNGWANHDPKQMHVIFDQLGESGSELGRAMVIALSADLESHWDWIQDRPEVFSATTKARMLGFQAFDFSQRMQGQQALQEFVGSLTEDLDADALREIGSGLAPAIAIPLMHDASTEWVYELVQSLPHDDVRALLLSEGVRRLLGHGDDGAKASEFLAAIPRNFAKRDELIVQLLERIGHDDDTALAWAEDISDEGTRQATLAKVRRKNESVALSEMELVP